ncbi:MAG: hypothetical protein ACJ789_21285 [Thermomicrobiales bacterium]
MADDLVYAIDSGTLYAVEVATGQERWRLAVAGGSSSVLAGGVLVILGSLLRAAVVRAAS